MSIAVSQNNKPQSSVLLYAMDDDFTFYFATHRDSHKAQTLLSNPAISLNVWQHGEMLVQADGTVTIIQDADAVSAVLDKLANAASKDEHFWPPVFRISGDEYIVFKITPHWMRSLNLNTAHMTESDSPFYEFTFSS